MNNIMSCVPVRVIVALVLALPAIADAQCVMFDKPEELFARADVVFVGTIVSTEPTHDQGSHVIVDIGTFRVEQSWKGRVEREMRVGADRLFEMNKKYLVFAAGKPLSTSILCRSTELVDRVKAKLDWLAKRPASRDADVYRALLADSYCSGLGRTAGRNALVIHRVTQSLPERDLPGGRSGEVNTEILRRFRQLSSDDVTAFLEANRREKPVPAAILEAPNVTPIDQSTLDALEGLGGKFWNEFYARYPGSTGYVRLGAVTVDPDRPQVVAYCGRQYGSLGGEGHLFVLVRGETGWRVVAKLLLWES